MHTCAAAGLIKVHLANRSSTKVDIDVPAGNMCVYVYIYVCVCVLMCVYVCRWI